jgi:hypothetical protein
MNEKYKKKLIVSAEMSRLHREYAEQIPFISFPSDLKVKIIPPFGGAVVRFLVAKGENEVSVYLDCESNLVTYGAYNKPYWEIYPYQGDTFRCAIDEVDVLIKHIEKALNN